MTGKKPNVILTFKKVKEEEMGNYRMLIPQENMEQILWDSTPNTSNKRK